MRYSLKDLVRQSTRRKSITFKEIDPLKRDQDALARIYMQVIRHWEDARKRLNREYEATMADYVRDTVDDIQSAIDQEAAWFESVFLSLEVQITEWTYTVQQWHARRWAQIAQPFIPSTVNLETLLTAGDVQNTLEATIRGNLALVRDVNAQQIARMSESVFRGLNQRLPARDVAKELQAITQFGRKRSLRIAQDQLQKLTSSLDGERMQQAGITEFTWRHSGKRHPRDWHKARNGKRYNLLTRKQSDGNGDEIIPADDMPGYPPFCGCKKQAYLAIEGVEDD